MVSSINDKVRKYIFKDALGSLMFKRIMSLNSKNKEYVLRLLLSDYYKVNYLSGINEKLSIFRQPMDYILDLCLNNNNFLIMVLGESICFSASPIISKIITLETISNDKLDSKLSSINKFHFLDKISYEFSYELEDLKRYYINFFNRSSNPIDNHILSSEYLSDKISLLEYKDVNKYEQYIIDFMREYYKWNLFMRDAVKKEPRIPYDYNYLNRIRDCSINDLLYDASKNYQLLFLLVSNYLYYTSLTTDEEKNIVDKYFNVNVKPDIQKKLNIKRDFK